MTSTDKQEESAHPRPDISVTKSSPNKKDLMISYSHADKDIMLKVRDNLEKYGISVWVDVSGLSAGVDFLSKIGEAIIDCKLFLSLLSSNSVKSKYCQDELALAYVSNRAIFPVAIQSRKDLLPLMDTGM
ncbi:WD-40 repeat-containing protein [Elysia marginata]|uniref:WD-40 repeat-containing protein n=1 Tax=Elysia marginata TaxID=1093978 RepID=A0AAV4FUV7_9GAST|nr:WD-40 repeat-containing protein [Elysia marginata]